jgi:hypothetical protein
LEKQALREAQKALDRHGADQFRTLQLARLKIQTMEPWKRFLLAFLGLASGLGAYGVLLADIRWLSGLLFLLAGGLLLKGILGSKLTIENALDGMDLSYLFDALIDL